MNPHYHEKSERYCPFCWRALWISKASGLEFCPDDPECGYEVIEGAKPPLTLTEKQQAQLDKKRRDITHYQGIIAKLADECAELERELGIDKEKS